MLHTCSSVKAQNRRALLERKSNLKSLRREGKSLFKDCSKLVMNMIHLEYKRGRSSIITRVQQEEFWSIDKVWAFTWYQTLYFLMAVLHKHLSLSLRPALKKSWSHRTKLISFSHLGIIDIEQICNSRNIKSILQNIGQLVPMR